MGLQEFDDCSFQGTMCLDSGTYIANLNGCHVCGRKDAMIIANWTEHVNENEREFTEYERWYL